MDATLAYLHGLKDQIERASVPAQRKPWPVSSKPDFANGIRMSDGTTRVFRSYGRAMKFLALNPPPAVREQLEASLRADYHAEEMEHEHGPLSRDADFDERFEPEEDR